MYFLYPLRRSWYTASRARFKISGVARSFVDSSRSCWYSCPVFEDRNASPSAPAYARSPTYSFADTTAHSDRSLSSASISKWMVWLFKWLFISCSVFNLGLSLLRSLRIYQNLVALIRRSTDKLLAYRIIRAILLRCCILPSELLHHLHLQLTFPPSHLKYVSLSLSLFRKYIRTYF